MIDLDCFLFIDAGVPEEKRTISVLCVECHNEKMPDTGVFYQGSVEGYSDYNWNCCLCGKYIHKVDEDEDEEVDSNIGDAIEK
jgi:hypothetical protein